MKTKVARIIGIVVAVPLAITAIIAFLIFVPQCQTASIRHDTTRLEREDNARRTLAQIIGGFVVLAGASIAWWRLRVAQEELKVTREGQVTERFSRAIEHLGNSSLDVRLGGIYALERIARDSRRDHWPIMEILTAYVREHAQWDPPPADEQPAADEPRPALLPDPGSGDDDKPPRLATDIQAVLTILKRRQANYDPSWEGLDLCNTDLRGANLYKATLQRANFSKANLQRAYLSMATLQGAYFIGADLQRARLAGADLQWSRLAEANLQGARLMSANLRGADLRGSDLTGADLQGADLNEAFSLTSQQLRKARGDKHTKLPPGVERPEHWPAEREDGG